MGFWVYVVLAVVSCLSSCLGMTPYGGRGAGPDGDQAGSGRASGSASTSSFQDSVPFILGASTQTRNRLDPAALPGSSTGGGGSFTTSDNTRFPNPGSLAVSSDGSFPASGDRGFLPTGSPATFSGGSFPASADKEFLSANRPASSSDTSFAATGDNVFPSFDRPTGQDDILLGGSAFTRSVIQEQPTLTVTQTVTQDAFTTLTDTVFNTFAVTLTQFALQTTTRPLKQVVVTPIDDYYTIRTTILESPTFVTVTETKSDFRLFVRTSVAHVTLTHTSYAITHVPFTITATETVHITSPMVKTVISTHRQLVTDYRTIINTVYVHGGYL